MWAHVWEEQSKSKFKTICYFRPGPPLGGACLYLLQE